MFGAKDTEDSAQGRRDLAYHVRVILGVLATLSQVRLSGDEKDVEFCTIQYFMRLERFRTRIEAEATYLPIKENRWDRETIENAEWKYAMLREVYRKQKTLAQKKGEMTQIEGEIATARMHFGQLKLGCDMEGEGTPEKDKLMEQMRRLYRKTIALQDQMTGIQGEAMCWEMDIEEDVARLNRDLEFQSMPDAREEMQRK
ncbi:hypothetical protein B7494_g5626 [Chlorociboria aeruginascens]|nr:hypothetical protein B7494_g5626 [Chlorociboria aeruginascens]